MYIQNFTLFMTLSFFLVSNSMAYEEHSISIDVMGTKREGLVLKPHDHQSDQKRRLLIILHGGTGSHERARKMANIEKYIDEQNLVVIFPDAIIDGQKKMRHWNDGRSQSREHGNDVKFMLELKRFAIENYNVDQNETFLSGVSNGGLMTSRMICESSQSFKGFIQVVATMPEDLYPNCSPTAPTNILVILGTRDRLIQFNGGAIPTFGKKGLGGNIISAQSLKKLYRESNGCLGTPSKVAKIDPFQDGKEVHWSVYEGCRENKRVEFMDVIGGGHGYPTPHRFFNKAGRDIDTTQEILRFMSDAE